MVKVHLNSLSLILNSRKVHLALVVILALSAFTHLWNVSGFPEIFYDEGVYMRRAMHVISGQGPQEAQFYDHPFFGQLFLGGMLGIADYPDSLHTTTDADSIAKLYAVPRILMGLLAVFDTFLIYKIADKRYGKKVAIIAALLFAVMPITWLFRRILLDAILMPFLLLSIYFAMASKESKHKTLLVLLSGTSLGLAIFTKIPAFTMIPLVAYLVYSGTKDKRLLILWLAPVLLIPLMWPAQSISSNQFDHWEHDVLWQTQRHGMGIENNVITFLVMDPVLFGTGIVGIAYVGMRKNYFVLLWAIPFVVFLAVIGYSQYFHWIPILPVFCIAGALVVADVGMKLNSPKLRQLLPVCTVLIIGGFGLASTSILINANVTGNQFEAVSFVSKYIQNNPDVTVLASPSYSWIFKSVFDMNTLPDYDSVLFRPMPTQFVLMADPHYAMDIHRGEILGNIYNSSLTITVFDGSGDSYDNRVYPYSNMRYNSDAGKIEIKTNVP